MPSSTRQRAVMILLGLFVLGLPLLSWMATFYTDYLWFVDVGQRGVFTTTLLSRLAVGAAFGVATFLLLFVNMLIARRMAPRAVLHSIGDLPPQVEDVVINLRAKAGPLLDRLVFGGAIVAGIVGGLAMAEYWHVVRLALEAVPFGMTDPQFGRDIGFYVFTLPALRMLADWLPAVLVFTVVASAFVHLVDGAIQPWARLKGFAPHVKAHLSVLMGLIVASKAFDYYLDIYELNFSPRGQVTGASFTDVNAQIPALRILIAIAALSAVVLLVNIRFKGWRLPAIALGVWLGASLLVGGVYPAIVQQFRVVPNEVAAEAPFIERNIMSTREAFGLDEIETRQFPAAEDLTAQDVVENTDTLQNVRLWDPAIVTQSYRQLQIIRPYYDFTDVDIDRYEIDGRMRQVLISARELDVEQLDAQAQNWVNQHLVYTHGYGVAMSPVNESDSRGLPDFIIKDIPPVSSAEIEVTQPAIYFGERTTDYIIVNTSEDIQEFDYPVGDQNAFTSYDGDAGVTVGGLVRRVAFALRYGASQILFSGYIEPESRIVFDRDVATRIEKLAPWIWQDSDPYPVVVDGRIVWVIDGYTYSDKYPYSEPFFGVSYVRNSVKMTVDAYDGTTTIYGFDPEDPVLATWGKIFPGLITSAEEIPEEIAAHFRYPETLFRLQAEAYKNYHMTDPKVFYNKEDSWWLPGQATEEGPMDPFYVLTRLPGESTEDFQMIIPFTPRNRDNMIGWMAAKSDPAEYGKRIVYQFPKQKVILGPEQVGARINQDEDISPQLTLWSQRGSQVIQGNMLVIPIKESIVYIQPLYLQAEQAAIPQLTRVLVVYADKVEMAPDLETALLQVFGEVAPPDTDDPDSGEPGGSGAEASVAEAQRLYLEALDAQRAGDWAAYGTLIEQLGRLLDNLAGPAPLPSVEETVTP